MIRIANAADLPTIASLTRAFATHEGSADRLDLDEARLGQALFGTMPVAEVLLAETGDGEPVGYALFLPKYNSLCGRVNLYLEDLFVLPRFHRQGFATALMAELTAIGRRRGCAQIDWAVSEANEAGISFYRSLGAYAMTDRRNWRLPLTGETAL